MRNDYYSNSKDYINRWVISYADFITMLLALFMVMWAINGMDLNKAKQAQKEMQQAFSTAQVQPNTLNATEQDKIIEKLSENNDIKSKTKLLKGEKGAIIRINDKMLFAPGSAIIKPEVVSTLDNIADELVKLDNQIIIEGHTDSSPINNTQFPSNWELSTARATNIIKYLITQKGLSPKKLSAIGYGEYEPIAPNTTIEGKAMNRRVDIIILDKKK
ncbi:MAG: OmpA family protein [Candidatus Gastranaerophilales bacterium]|nr:OmpA family protein [Candidatus Gastranaerophilales bacterium]